VAVAAAAHTCRLRPPGGGGGTELPPAAGKRIAPAAACAVPEQTPALRACRRCGRWRLSPHHLRDEVVDFVRTWLARTGIIQKLFVIWRGIRPGNYYFGRLRYGRVNAYNGRMPRDFRIKPWEREAIAAFHDQYPLEGHRRLTFMMLDRDAIASSPSTTYRVLRAAGLIGRREASPSMKDRGFAQPTRPHQHWHVDIAYLNICSTFYYVCSMH
jgi:hypothetical protein